MNYTVSVDSADVLLRAASLAEAYHFGLDDPSAAVQLRWIDGRLCVHINDGGDCACFKPTGFDLSQINVNSSGGDKKQPLARACGLHKRSGLRILDACAGCGVDAFILASLGASLVSCELNPVVHALLTDAMQHDAAGFDWQLRLGDVRDYLHEDSDFDCIYLDPMFAPEKRRGAVSKEIRILEFLDQSKLSNDDLFATAAAASIPRLVIKQPLRAAVHEFSERNYLHGIAGRGFRLDVYNRSMEA